ncbi:rnhA, partial [Mucuna pruriens]
MGVLYARRAHQLDRERLTTLRLFGNVICLFILFKNSSIIPTVNPLLGNEEPDQSNTPSESVSTEVEALANIEQGVGREKTKFEATTKDLESVNLQEGTEGREVRIGKQLPPTSRAKLLELLKEYADVFDWSYQDMPGLDREIVEHRLPLLPGATPVRQQLRRMKPEVALKIKEKVEKQWNAGFLAVANYPRWVANIVPAPRIELEVRGFLGQINFISRFISQLTATCSPIFKLLRKKQKKEWDTECQEAFDKIKRYLENPPVLVPAAPGQPLILYLTVLEESMGCALGQQDATGRKEQAIYYLSKKFTECEARYSALEQTCYTIWAAKRLRPYMLSHTTWLVAKNDLVKYIFEKPALTRRIAHWQMALSEYDILYINQTVVKGSALAKQLAHHALTDSQPLSYEFPDEHLMAAAVDKFDGASNIVGNGIGVVLISPNNQCFPFAAKLGFDCTNNMAEYEACTMGLLMALDHQVKKLRVFGDSALVIYQLRGEWEIRDAKLMAYNDHAREIMTAFDMITFSHVPREENQTADALATLSAMVQVNEGQELVIQVRQQPQTAYCQCLTCEIAKPSTEPWYYDIKRYLEKGEYPDETSENSKRTLRCLASGFLLSGTTLYKRNSDMTLLRCVDDQEAKQIMEEVHEGIFGTHINGHALARKILRAGYYWT